MPVPANGIPPIVPAWPALAATDAGPPQPPKPARPANCGVGYQAPPAPAVVPVPNVSCWAIWTKNPITPTPKYACKVCLMMALRLLVVSPSPHAPWPKSNPPSSEVSVVDAADADESCWSAWGTVAADVNCWVAVVAVACAAAPAGVPPALVTAAAWLARPAALVASGGGVNGVTVEAADEAPA